MKGVIFASALCRRQNAFGLFFAQLVNGLRRVLGNVMEQTAEIQGARLDQLLDDLAGERKLAAEFRHGERRQVAQAP